IGFRFPGSDNVEAGWAPRVDHASRILSGLATTSSPPFRYEPFFQRDHTNWATTSGVVAGGGVQIAAGRLQLSPEVRYTHWSSQPIQGYFGDGPSYGSSQGRIDILLGVTWRTRK